MYACVKVGKKQIRMMGHVYSNDSSELIIDIGEGERFSMCFDNAAYFIAFCERRNINYEDSRGE